MSGGIMNFSNNGSSLLNSQLNQSTPLNESNALGQAQDLSQTLPDNPNQGSLTSPAVNQFAQQNNQTGGFGNFTTGFGNTGNMGFGGFGGFPMNTNTAFGTQPTQPTQQTQQKPTQIPGRTMIGTFNDDYLNLIKKIIKKKVSEQQVKRKINLQSITELKTKMNDVLADARYLKIENNNTKKSLEEIGLKTRRQMEFVEMHQKGNFWTGQSFLLQKCNECEMRLKEIIERIDKTSVSCTQADDNFDISEIQAVFETNVISLRYLASVIEGLKNWVNGLLTRYNIQEKKMMEMV